MDYANVMKWVDVIGDLMWPIASMATLAIAIITGRTLISQTRPKIIIYTHHDYRRPGYLKIRIHNIGKDVAKEICFETEKGNPIPGVKRPLLTKLPSLGPGEYREFGWGILVGKNSEFRDKVSGGIYTIKYTYHQDRTLFPGKKPFKGEDVIEAESYIGRELIDLSPNDDIVKAMEKWHIQLVLTLKAALAARGCDDSKE